MSSPTARWSFEAVREFEDEKLDVFAKLGKVVIDEDAILASNTSSIPIMKLAMATERPEHVVGPALLQPGAGACAWSSSSRRS